MRNYIIKISPTAFVYYIGRLHRGRDVCSERTESARHSGGLWDGGGKGQYNLKLIFECSVHVLHYTNAV